MDAIAEFATVFDTLRGHAEAARSGVDAAVADGLGEFAEATEAQGVHSRLKAAHLERLRRLATAIDTADRDTRDALARHVDEESLTGHVMATAHVPGTR
ncbi:hypothetical protein [Stackebrandtia albiflava]|uniref:hypothetical protein n=1 Tax=Stackebrandtia albiflava TaxID=406432 RepID=UPI0011BE1472|nr:hypothetical protein [Stackebrandtia albiflava]